MEKTGFTPGPWYIDPCLDILGNTSDGNGLVCAVTTDGVMPDEANANAHLIAAAPELYETLKIFFNTYSFGINPDLDEAHRKARAALSKVEG